MYLFYQFDRLNMLLNKFHKIQYHNMTYLGGIRWVSDGGTPSTGFTPLIYATINGP
jgi:hypothetical protein